MSEENGASRKIRVVDRRRFTDSGDLRDDSAAAAQPPRPDTPSPPRVEATPAEPRASRETPVTSQTFLELIATLAQQAELLAAGGQGLPRQGEQARRLVDYLGVLETKTRGNLSAEEKQVLSNVVFQLRSLIVQYNR